jgi:F-type H+-transporting ATPase subunit epsilon
VATLTVQLVTPDAALWQGAAQSLAARSSVGEFTVLPEHAPMVTDLVPGVVRIRAEEGELDFAVHGGYFQVGPGDGEDETLATLLASVAERTSDIDVARAEAAKARAEAALAAAAQANAEDLAQYRWARPALERAELRLRAATR